jgi:hypothetical protein
MQEADQNNELPGDSSLSSGSAEGRGGEGEVRAVMGDETAEAVVAESADAGKLRNLYQELSTLRRVRPFLPHLYCCSSRGTLHNARSVREGSGARDGRCFCGAQQKRWGDLLELFQGWRAGGVQAYGPYVPSSRAYSFYLQALGNRCAHGKRNGQHCPRVSLHVGWGERTLCGWMRCHAMMGWDALGWG